MAGSRWRGTRAGLSSSRTPFRANVWSRASRTTARRSSGAPTPSRFSRRASTAGRTCGPPRRIDRDPADRAGGAEFGHIELGHQRELKRQVLADALSRMAGIDSDVVVEAGGGRDGWAGLAHRGSGLHVGDDGRLGQYAARSHRVIAVPDLPLAPAGARRGRAARPSASPANEHGRRARPVHGRRPPGRRRAEALHDHRAGRRPRVPAWPTPGSGRCTARRPRP